MLRPINSMPGEINDGGNRKRMNYQKIKKKVR